MPRGGVLWFLILFFLRGNPCIHDLAWQALAGAPSRGQTVENIQARDFLFLCLPCLLILFSGHCKQGTGFRALVGKGGVGVGAEGKSYCSKNAR